MSYEITLTVMVCNLVYMVRRLNYATVYKLVIFFSQTLVQLTLWYSKLNRFCSIFADALHYPSFNMKGTENEEHMYDNTLYLNEWT